MSSGYYYRKYKEYKEKAKRLDNNRKKLVPIEEAFHKNPVQGDPDDVNKIIGKCVSYLQKGLSGDGGFNALYSAVESTKEKSVMQDQYLNPADRALVSEINRLISERDKAQRESDRYYRLYREALAAERAAASKS